MAVGWHNRCNSMNAVRARLKDPYRPVVIADGNRGLRRSYSRWPGSTCMTSVSVMQTIRAKAALALTALALTLAMSIAHAGALTPFVADYSLSAGWIPLGEARFTLKPTDKDDCYVYRYVAKATGLVSVFRGDTLTEESQFCVMDGRIRSQRESFTHEGGDGDDDYVLVFDWAHATVTNQHSGKTRSLPADGLDRQVIQLWLRRKLERAGDHLPTAPFNVTLVDDDRNVTYTLKVMGHERVKVDMGTFDTVRVDRIDTHEKTVRFWLSPALDYLPVKVVQKDKDHMAIVLELKAVPKSPSGESAQTVTENGGAGGNDAPHRLRRGGSF